MTVSTPSFWQRIQRRYGIWRLGRRYTDLITIAGRNFLHEHLNEAQEQAGYFQAASNGEQQVVKHCDWLSAFIPLDTHAYHCLDALFQSLANKANETIHGDRRWHEVSIQNINVRAAELTDTTEERDRIQEQRSDHLNQHLQQNATDDQINNAIEVKDRQGNLVNPELRNPDGLRTTKARLRQARALCAGYVILGALLIGGEGATLLYFFSENMFPVSTTATIFEGATWQEHTTQCLTAATAAGGVTVILVALGHALVVALNELGQLASHRTDKAQKDTWRFVRPLIKTVVTSTLLVILALLCTAVRKDIAKETWRGALEAMVGRTDSAITVLITIGVIGLAVLSAFFGRVVHDAAKDAKYWGEQALRIEEFLLPRRFGREEVRAFRQRDAELFRLEREINRSLAREVRSLAQATRQLEAVIPNITRRVLQSERGLIHTVAIMIAESEKATTKLVVRPFVLRDQSINNGHPHHSHRNGSSAPRALLIHLGGDTDAERTL